MTIRLNIRAYGRPLKCRIPSFYHFVTNGSRLNLFSAILQSLNNRSNISIFRLPNNNMGAPYNWKNHQYNVNNIWRTERNYRIPLSIRRARTFESNHVHGSLNCFKCRTGRRFHYRRRSPSICCHTQPSGRHLQNKPNRSHNLRALFKNSIRSNGLWTKYKAYRYIRLGPVGSF